MCSRLVAAVLGWLLGRTASTPRKTCPLLAPPPGLERLLAFLQPTAVIHVRRRTELRSSLR